MNGPPDGLAHAAWEAYCQEYITRFWRRPPHVSRAPNGKPIYRAFDKIAATCTRNEFDVYDYIKTCFDTVEKNSNYITPNDFIGEPYIQRHKQYLKTHKNHSSSEFAFLLDRLLQIAKVKKINELELVQSAAYNFPAWFRIFATAEMNPELWQWYGQPAWNQLRLNTQMRRLLKSVNADLFNALEEQYGRFGD